jgi:Na+-transporting NADH:ubiquinone oxidoreductase subunit NqrD
MFVVKFKRDVRMAQSASIAMKINMRFSNSVTNEVQPFVIVVLVLFLENIFSLFVFVISKTHSITIGVRNFEMECSVFSAFCNKVGTYNNQLFLVVV